MSVRTGYGMFRSPANACVVIFGVSNLCSLASEVGFTTARGRPYLPGRGSDRFVSRMVNKGGRNNVNHRGRVRPAQRDQMGGGNRRQTDRGHETSGSEAGEPAGHRLQSSYFLLSAPAGGEKARLGGESPEKSDYYLRYLGRGRARIETSPTTT
jgi:hypothetical protein